jgi:uncharacterized membrane protein
MGPNQNLGELTRARQESSGRAHETQGTMDKTRLESFSDGVFAFAITLLVLGVPIPDLKNVDDLQLRSGLLHSMQQLVPYVTSFATIGIIWLNHHAMFHMVERVDHGTLILNLLLLFVVSFIPFPTAVLGRYGASPSAAFLYGIVLTALGISFSSLSFYIQRRRLDAKMVRSGSRRKSSLNWVGTIAYPIAALLALAAPRVAITMYFLLAGFYLLQRNRFSASQIVLDEIQEPSQANSDEESVRGKKADSANSSERNVRL